MTPQTSLAGMWGCVVGLWYKEGVMLPVISDRKVPKIKSVPVTSSHPGPDRKGCGDDATCHLFRPGAGANIMRIRAIDL